MKKKLKNLLPVRRAYANKHNQISIKNYTIKENFNYIFYQIIILNIIYSKWIKIIMFISLLFFYKLSIKYNFQIDIFNTSFAEESIDNTNQQQYIVKLTWMQIIILIVIFSFTCGIALKWSLNIIEELNKLKADLDKTNMTIDIAFRKIEDGFQRMDDTVTGYASKVNLRDDIIDQLFIDYKNRAKKN